MGMAASQARYLSLSARKTNCEYEGQQINQQRLNLSNQSAVLFNQMLTMSVPMPPSSTDFTRLQYSWVDGDTVSVIESYYQIGKNNDDFNYVVSSYHYENVYTGQRKFIKDPQVQATKTNHFTRNTDKHYTIRSVTYDNLRDKYAFQFETADGIIFNAEYELSEQDTNKDVVEELDFLYSDDRIAGTIEHDDLESITYNADYTVLTYNSTDYTKIDLDSATPEEIKKLKQTYGALFSELNTYYKSADNTYICATDIEKAKLEPTGTVTIRKEDTNKYYTDGVNFFRGIDLQGISVGDDFTLVSAKNDPTFSNYSAIGNSKVSELSIEEYESDSSIDIEIQQLLKDLKIDENNAVAYERIKNCFDEDGKYIGGLYTFTLGGERYYTTAADMDESLLSAYDINSVASNSIDSQQAKLSYYKAVYIKQKITEIKKALLETDGQGRFSTAKFEDDSVIYTLNVETIKDDDAYNDAMNKYYYDKEEYDKQVADINAKTEIIQAQDRQLQLKLEQLNTEQSALQTEMEACQKVVSKDIDQSFKTFSS